MASGIPLSPLTRPGPALKPPTAAVVLLAAGGCFLVLVGLEFWIGGSTCLSRGPGPAQNCSQYAEIGLLYIGLGVFSTVGGLSLLRFPARHSELGWTVTAAAVLTNGLGFFLLGPNYALLVLSLLSLGSIPFVLLFVGAGLAWQWRPAQTGPHPGAPYGPSRSAPYPPPPPPWPGPPRIVLPTYPPPPPPPA
jgi:hypothetical protein